MHKLIHKLMKILPPLLTVLLAVCLAFALKDLSLKQLLSYVPANLLVAGFVLVGLYAVKSLSVVFPLSILYLIAGVIYPLWAAILINLLGLAVCVSVPYLLGRLYGSHFVSGLTQKYPKLNKLLQLGISNEVLLSYLMRIVGVLPGDLCSLFLGSCRTSYPHYLAGSLIGLAPVMIIHVLFADVLSTGVSVGFQEALTPSFFLFSVLLIGISVFSSFLFNRKAKRERS